MAGMQPLSPPARPLAEQTAAARAAQKTWAARPVRERLRFVERFRQVLVAARDRLCAVVGEEIDKPPAEVISGEIVPTADACAFLVREAEGVLRPRSVSRKTPLWMFGSRHAVHRRPRGVVGVIGTWNYPLFLNAGQI